MSQQSDPTVFPPCRRDGEGCTTPAANSVHDSSGPASTGASLSLSKTPNLIHPAEASVATSTQPDSQRYPVPTNPHLGTDFSSARLFASSDTGNHPATADLEDQRSTGHDQTKLHDLKSSNPPVAVTEDVPNHNHGTDHALPKPSGHVSSTSVPTLASSTSAQMLPPPPGPLDKSKSIWAPQWVHQQEDGWKESLRRDSGATVSPHTMPAVRARGFAQPVTQLAEPSEALHTPKVDESVQKAGPSHSEDAEIEYQPPKVALMAYLDRLAKVKGERALSMGEKDRSYMADERLTEIVCPPVRQDITQGRGRERRVMRTYDQSETDADVEVAEPKREPKRDCQPGLERTAYPILPSFAHMLRTAGLTNDELSHLPWETPNSSGYEQNTVTTRSHDHSNSASSLLQHQSHNLPATNPEMARTQEQDEFILRCRREAEQREADWVAYVKQVLANTPENQALPSTDRGMVDTQVKVQPTYDGQVHQREHLLATNFNQPVANSSDAQDLSTTNSRIGLPPDYSHTFQRAQYTNVDKLVVYPPGSVPATNQGMIDAQMQLQQIEAAHLRRRDFLAAQYIRKNFKPPMDSLPEAQELPAVTSGQPSDGSVATHLQYASPAYLERHTPADIQHASQTPSQTATSNYLDRYAPAHIQDNLKDIASSHLERSAPSHLQRAAPSHLDRHAPTHLQRAASQRSSDEASNFDEFGFDPEPQYHMTGFAPETDSSKASYGLSAQQFSLPFASQAQGEKHASSSAPQNIFRPSFAHSAQQGSVPVASQVTEQHKASSPTSPSSFHPSYLQSSISQAGPLQPGMQQGFTMPSAAPYTGLHKHGRTESDFRQAQTDLRSGYGVAYGQDVRNLTRLHGQSVVEKALQPNMALDNWSYGQGSFARPSFQTTLQPPQSYGDVSFAANPQPIPVHWPSPYTNLQMEGTQPQQYTQARPVVGGRTTNRVTRRSNKPAVQTPLYAPPDWNPQPGATAGIWTMQQYTGGSSQQPQQQAPYGQKVTASSLSTVGTINQTLASGPNVHGPVEPRYNYQASDSMPPSKRVRHYRPGGDAMYPQVAPGASGQYQALTQNGQPSLEAAAQGGAPPFVEASKEAGPAEWGVVKIGNIPYSVTKQEIMAFLGRNAKIITPDLGVAIHVIMERSTSKTMDCFVEFLSYGDALAVVNKFTRSREDGRHLRVGDRHVAVEMSCQDVLMKELFPRAKNVVWQGGNPIIMQNDEPFNSGFRSFLTSEETVMLVKHAEQPHRSPFSQKCLQRTYESLVSTLEKYPWWCTHLYTIGDRDLLFGATEQQIRALVTQLKRGGAPGLTLELLTELIYAGLNAPGFSEWQRAKLVAAAESVVQGIRISPLAAFWPFETLSRREGVPEDVIEHYAAIIREATTSTALVPFAMTSAQAGPRTSPSPFGDVSVPWPADKGCLKMAMAAALEWSVLERLLRKVLRDDSGSSGSG